MVAVKNKNSFCSAQYQQLLVRRGKKKVVVAVAHSMLIEMLASHFYESRDSSTGGFFADNV